MGSLQVKPVFVKPSKNPLSYRPISLTSCVARVLEKALNMQIRKYLEVNKLIYDHQSGFYRNTPPVTRANCATSVTPGHEWTMALDQRQCVRVQAAFLDLSKAYNRVPTAGLLFKLGCEFSPHSLKWMNSFLANRQRVKVGNMHSVWATLSCGIPQDTVLGPTLFLAFIREVLQYVITCQNTYVICHRALRQVLVLQHFAALWLDVKPKYPGCGLAPSSKQRKVCAFHPRVPKSKRWVSWLQHEPFVTHTHFNLRTCIRTSDSRSFHTAHALVVVVVVVVDRSG